MNLSRHQFEKYKKTVYYFPPINSNNPNIEHINQPGDNIFEQAEPNNQQENNNLEFIEIFDHEPEPEPVEVNNPNMANIDLTPLVNALSNHFKTRHQEPSIYHKGMDFSGHMQTVNRYITALGIADDEDHQTERKNVFIKYLAPELQTIAHSIDQQGNLTYNELAAQFTDKYGRNVQSAEARAALAKIGQYPNESLDEFAERCSKTALRAFGTLGENVEAFITEKFCQGVYSRDLREKLCVSTFANVNEAMIAAKRIQEFIRNDVGNINQVQGSVTEVLSKLLSNIDRPRTEFRRNFEPCRRCGRGNHPTFRCQAPFCKICRKIGHETRFCFRNQTNSFNRYPGPKCFNCGLTNHLSRDCRRPNYAQNSYRPNSHFENRPNFNRDYRKSRSPSQSREGSPAPYKPLNEFMTGRSPAFQPKHSRPGATNLGN